MLRKKITRAEAHHLELASRFFAEMAERPEDPHIHRSNDLLELLVKVRDAKPNSRKWSDLHRHLNGTFFRYKWVRRIEFTGGEPSTYAAPFRIQEDPWERQMEEWEYMFVGFLLELADSHPKLLMSITHCQCGRWMFARRANNRFCSGKCRQNAYDNDPARHAERLQRLRDAYAIKKRRAARAAEAAGFSRKRK